MISALFLFVQSVFSHGNAAHYACNEIKVRKSSERSAAAAEENLKNHLKPE